MSDHPNLRQLIEGVNLPADERHELLSHLRGCAGCRAELAERDPSLLFAVLALEPVPDGVLDRVSRSAEAAIAREQRRSTTRRTYAWGSLAASIVVAGLLGAYFWTQRGLDAPPDRPAVVDAIPAPAADAAMPAGMIELLDSPGSADVVEMTVGDVEVVMIFDKAMGI
jgi:hypothetical protein